MSLSDADANSIICSGPWYAASGLEAIT
jgi:hypothetical protein